MTSPKNNLLEEKELPIKTSKKGKIPKFFFYFAVFCLVFVTIFSFQIILSGDSISQTIEKINIFQNLGISITEDKPLKGEADDRINILLLGMGGEGHPGPYLTDTIILVSVKPSNGQVSMVSIPRDLSIPIDGYGWRKINNANHFGEMEESGQGAKYAAEVISDTFDIPIHYYVRVDFSGFETLINELGGIDVYVDTAFTDYQFPTDDFGYQTVSYEEGWQQMDGQTALNYSRSRHGTNGENSDFARSRRQQKVLAAVKEKALSFSTFLSYKKISALYDLYKDKISTNLEPWEMYEFYKMSKDINTDNINNIVLEIGNNGPLYSTIINEAYLLLPNDMSFKELQNIVYHALDSSDSNATESTAKLPTPVPTPKIEIQNGTKIAGLAARASNNLEDEGFKIVKIGNAQQQNYEHTIIYDITEGKKEADLKVLKEKLNALSSGQLPTDLDYNTTIDFLIILGQDISEANSLSRQ